MNPVWGLQNQRLLVLFRDPFARLLSAYRDLPSNPYIRSEVPRGANMTFGEFVDHVHADWHRISRNEHFTPQTTLCQPDRQAYWFVGTNENRSHVEHVYKDLLGATDVLRLHAAQDATEPAANRTKIGQMYAADYRFFDRQSWPHP